MLCWLKDIGWYPHTEKKTTWKQIAFGRTLMEMKNKTTNDKYLTTWCLPPWLFDVLLVTCIPCGSAGSGAGTYMDERRSSSANEAMYVFLPFRFLYLSPGRPVQLFLVTTIPSSFTSFTFPSFPLLVFLGRNHTLNISSTAFRRLITISRRETCSTTSSFQKVWQASDLANIKTWSYSWLYSHTLDFIQLYFPLIEISYHCKIEHWKSGKVRPRTDYVGCGIWHGRDDWHIFTFLSIYASHPRKRNETYFISIFARVKYWMMDRLGDAPLLTRCKAIVTHHVDTRITWFYLTTVISRPRQPATLVETRRNLWWSSLPLDPAQLPVSWHNGTSL